jgi:hypothetical protein
MRELLIETLEAAWWFWCRVAAGIGIARPRERRVVTQLPIIHPKGSGFKVLNMHYTAATRAIGMAITVLQEGRPRARDYPMRNGAFARACEEHRQRIAALEKIQDELIEIWGSLIDPEKLKR